MASTFITRTPSVAGNRKTFTISYWVKRGKLGTQQGVCGVYETANTNFQAMFNADDQIEMKFKISGANNKLQTNAKFRDTSAWYHIVLAVDTTDGTAANRFKLYVNGVQISSFDTATYPNQNVNTEVNLNGLQFRIGEDGNGGNRFDGSMSHFHLIDGTTYPATTFGSTDSTTGEWKINTGPSVTYGTNGFFILKDGNSVTDSSPNSNNFTVGGGTLTKTEDNPSNVFCTFNSLIPQVASKNGRNANATPSMDYGNTRVGEATAAFASQLGTIFAKTGKYYFEVKGTGDYYTSVGICNPNFSNDSLGSAIGRVSGGGNGVNNIGIYGASGGVYKSNVQAYSGDGFASQTVCVAMDLDNGFCYFRLDNGSWMNSGNPESGATGTGGVSIVDDFYTFAVTTHNASGGRSYMSANFGNGYFGTTAVSSAGTNASGIGIFEFNVPTGYTALSTKGLNL